MINLYVYLRIHLAFHTCKMKITKEPKVKLTLTVKKSAIEEAKKYATAEGSSLSSIVEDYLVKYSKKHHNSSNSTPNIADQLFGCAKNGPLSNMTDKEIKDLRIKERYNL